MNVLIKIFSQLFTLADNQTACLGRILWAVSLVAFIIVGTIQVLKTGNIDLLSFGGGICAILGGGGVAIRLKEPSEHKAT